MVNTNQSDKSAKDSQEALFNEMALLYDDKPLPEAGKTPTTPIQGADLAAAVDGGNGDLGPNSMPSQGLHVSSSVSKGKDIIQKGWKKAGISGLLDDTTVLPPVDPFLSSYSIDGQWQSNNDIHYTIIVHCLNETITSMNIIKIGFFPRR